MFPVIMKVVEDRKKKLAELVIITTIILLLILFFSLFIKYVVHPNGSNKLKKDLTGKEMIKYRDVKDINGNFIGKEAYNIITGEKVDVSAYMDSTSENNINSNHALPPDEEYVDDKLVGVDRTSEIYMKNHGTFTLPEEIKEELKLVNEEIYNLYSHFMSGANHIPQSARDPLLWSVKTFNETSEGTGLIASCLPVDKLGDSINPSMLYNYDVIDRVQDKSIFWMNNPQQGPFQMDANYGNRSGLIFPEEIGMDEATKFKEAGLLIPSRASRTPFSSKSSYGDRFNPHDMIQKQISEINSMYGIYYKQLEAGKIPTAKEYPLNDLGVYALMCTAYNSGGAFLSNPNGKATGHWFAPFHMQYANIYKFCSLISRAPIADYIEDKAIQSLEDGKKYPHKPSSDSDVLDWIQEWKDNGWIEEDILLDINVIKSKGTYRARPTYAIKSIYMYMQAVYIFYGA